MRIFLEHSPCASVALSKENSLKQNKKVLMSEIIKTRRRTKSGRKISRLLFKGKKRGWCSFLLKLSFCHTHIWKTTVNLDCFSPACVCTSIGSQHNTCDKTTGQCVCNNGYAGIRCDQCQVRSLLTVRCQRNSWSTACLGKDHWLRTIRVVTCKTSNILL